MLFVCLAREVIEKSLHQDAAGCTQALSAHHVWKDAALVLQLLIVQEGFSFKQSETSHIISPPLLPKRATSHCLQRLDWCLCGMV